MFYVGAIGLEKYDNDFQYKMSFPIRMRGDIPKPSVFLCVPSLFNFFLQLCLVRKCKNYY